MADQSLIRGAYEAAGGGIPNYNLAKSKALKDIGDAGAKLASKFGEQVQKRQKEFDEFAEWELSRVEGTMTTPEYKREEKRLKKMRQKYIISGKTEREMLLRELDQNSTQQQMSDELKKKIAKLAKDDKSGLSKNFTGSPTGESLIKGMLGAPTTNEETGEDEWEIINSDGEKEMMSAKKIWTMLDENTRDGSTQDLISNLASSSADAADMSLANDNGIFNYDQNYRNIKNQVVERGNFKSMVNDPDVLIEGRVFKDDLVEMIMTNSYGDLGIKDQKITRLDKRFGSEDGITQNDAKVIADKLLENEYMSKKYLTTYITNYLEKNWISENKNVGNNKNIANSNNQISELKPNKNPQLNPDEIKLYSSLDPSKVEEAKEYNMSTYGTHNPTLESRKLNISLEELAQRKKQKDAMDLINNNSELSDEEKEYEPQSQRNTDYA